MHEVVKTGDGSSTLYNAEVGECYHSKHGALTESKYVFLHKGLEHYLEMSGSKSARVLEVGFGTGLNALLTLDYALENQMNLVFESMEAFPLKKEQFLGTGYERFVSNAVWEAVTNGYEKLLAGQQVQVGPGVGLSVFVGKLLDYSTDENFDVIYFDAFAGIHQPEMWTKESLEMATRYLVSGGVFTTYAITGQLKRIMQELGFDIDKQPGAPGKREMLRALKK